MINRRWPQGFVNAFSLTGGTPQLINVESLANAIGTNALSQAINNNAYTDDITRYFPDEVAERVAQRAVGFKDDSVNTSELVLGADIMMRCYPGDAFEKKFTEGMTIFTLGKDRQFGGGITCATPPVINILQNRRAAIQQMRAQTGIQATMTSTHAARTAADLALLGLATYAPQYQSFTPRTDRPDATGVPVVARTDAARRYEESLLSGTQAVMSLTADNANEFDWNCFGALIKLEPGAEGAEPIGSIAVPGIAESRVCSQFGRPKANDYCFYLVRKWPREGLFQNAAYCGANALGGVSFAGGRNSELLQVRGFSSNDCPHTISGPSNAVELSDTFYVDKEKQMATMFSEVGDWDPETDTFKVLVRDTAQDALDNVPQVTYDAFLSQGRIFSCGQYKGRFPVKDSVEQQLAGTMSVDEYNKLERITIYNLRRHYK
jgi:hypothetical protein